jgi:hypothetical protein
VSRNPSIRFPGRCIEVDEKNRNAKFARSRNDGTGDVSTECNHRSGLATFEKFARSRTAREKRSHKSKDLRGL